MQLLGSRERNLAQLVFCQSNKDHAPMTQSATGLPLQFSPSNSRKNERRPAYYYYQRFILHTVLQNSLFFNMTIISYCLSMICKKVSKHSKNSYLNQKQYIISFNPFIFLKLVGCIPLPIYQICISTWHQIDYFNCSILTGQ